jgi:hypothetical protein
MASKPGFLQYVKKAFMQHWNLLLLGAGIVGGALSGAPDVVIPLVAAGELVYLGGLATHPKFQAHVKAQSHKEERKQVNQDSLQKVFNALDPRSRVRFEELRRRCTDLQTLSKGLRTADLGEMEVMHNEGINKLLWVFLKLLFTKRSLERFLESTRQDDINESIRRAEQRITELGPEEEDTATEMKMRHTLQDTLTSAQARLQNFTKAQENHEFIQLELERIESKIASIAEMAINRQDPDFITHEVDGVASTMEQTEHAMGELQFLDGLGEVDVAPPSFVQDLETLEQK